MISFSTSEYLASFYGTENVAIFFGQTFTLICELKNFIRPGHFRYHHSIYAPHLRDDQARFL